MYKKIIQLVFLIICVQTYGNTSDSSRYYFKLSPNVVYGIETFKYSGGHSYQHYEHAYTYSYGASVKDAKRHAIAYSAELKFDVDLPLGIKIVNGLSYSAFSFTTPQYNGSGNDGSGIKYTYTVEEDVSMSTTHAFFGLGYGRKIGKMILDADICYDLYRVSDLVMERKISVTGNTGNAMTPSKGAAYQKGEVTGGLGIRGTINCSYKVTGPLYLRAGLVYRSDLSPIKGRGYSGYENIHSVFTPVRAYMVNLGICLSVK